MNFIKNILRKCVNGKLTLNEAADLLICEMGRGSIVLFVDECCQDLIPFLVEKGYTVTRPYSGMPDKEILKLLPAKVMITNNARDFSEPKLRMKYRYALVSVPKFDPKELSKQVEKVLKEGRFAANDTQWIDLAYDRGKQKWKAVSK